MSSKSIAFCAAALAAASPSFLPSMVRAQAAGDVSHAAPAVSPGETGTPRAIEVTVDWVDVPVTDITPTNVGLGPNHDGRLMAALILNGAVDTKGPRLRTTEGHYGSIHLRTDVPTAVVLNGKPQKTVLHLDNFTEAIPIIHSDGTIAVEGGVQRAQLDPGVTPADEMMEFTALSSTFRDGEAQLLGGGGGGFQKHFLFVTVKTIAQKQASRK